MPLQLLRQEVQRDLLVEAKKHKAWKLLRQFRGSVRSSAFGCADADASSIRTERQLWTYSGLGLETHDKAQYHVREGQLQRFQQTGDAAWPQ